MAQQQRDGQSVANERGAARDKTFKRHGPEPPENDSGPSPSVEESWRASETPNNERHTDLPRGGRKPS
jgi:hypothetical protein